MNDSPQSSGILYGVSVGPGDPELITLKGLNILKKAPVVAFPAGIRGKSGIAEKIISPWLNSQQIQLPLNFPYVQDETILTEAWQLAAQQVGEYLAQGKDVAFACEGDVSFYSTFTYLAQTLQEIRPQLKVEAIPGVCSPLAAVASLGIPLTMREQRLAVLPALYTMSELEKTLDQADVVVLMKVSSVYRQVWQLLQQRDLLENAYVVEWATHPQQQIYAGLSDRPNLQLSYFSLMIVQGIR
ncbi:precorrin-2 C(20)-methyltransferase [Limnoraphis robusta]|uniref:Precorrin-2 C(20)-methyltransferase n=1 Tax=Limnoraphis robusta CCNP1315 TaxID=3110306 RepID=A0ABU5TVC2_9CYAN|nr:precorrin-2 C(20)-methyltransferase [Limnoraphis robusta]MEA5518834.1 precorrin-2 C(20)-methyltransferase [Limnoraphis robusta CCNP1315]MEA5549336.1 precorrin-2 C(20)-methyltransferase [Limnoraphis robusta CCNP1324]